MKIDRERLSQALKNRSLSLQRALKEAKVSPNAYFTLQRKKEILPKSLVRLSRSLGIPPSVLLADLPDPFRNVPDSVREAMERLKRFACTHHGFLVLFGSRVREKRARESSDWDFGFLGIRPCPLPSFAAAKGNAQETAWPFKLDFVDLNRAPLWFLKSIEDDIVLVSRDWTDEKAV